MDKDIWYTKEVCEYLRLSPRTLDRIRKAGGFPRPLDIPGWPRWLAEDVKKWLKSKAA